MRKLKKDFNQIFLVRVPIIATLTPLDSTVLGLPVTYTQFDGNVYYNEQTYFESTNVMINLHKILEIFSNGYPVSVIDNKTMTAIYEILEIFVFEVKNFLDNFKLQDKLRQILQDEYDITMRFLTEILHYNQTTLEKVYKEKYLKQQENNLSGYGYIEDINIDKNKLPKILFNKNRGE